MLAFETFSMLLFLVVMFIAPFVVIYLLVTKAIGYSKGIDVTFRNPVVINDKEDKIRELEAEIAELRKRGTARSGRLNDVTPEEWDSVKF